MSIPDLTFDEFTHTYRFQGRRVAHVTGVIDILVGYDAIPADVRERVLLEGHHIHTTVELHVKNDLHEKALPDWLKPRLEAFKQFVAETGFVMEASESRVYHPIHRYAGQLDLVGTLPLLHRDTAILDIKRSLFAGPVIGLQTAAYLEAENERRRKLKLAKVKRRYALQLKPNGRYALQEFKDDGDFTVFVGLLNAYRYCERHGINRIWNFNHSQEKAA
jgi:hypothetical protein